ncbi:putative protein-like [Forsythia ovata]|uniref:Uncharacterized protein n=1 Tax=Forsythia ovata TaxID=205694 RepID=A0ABD1WRE3_9LAMI
MSSSPPSKKNLRGKFNEVYSYQQVADKFPEEIFVRMTLDVVNSSFGTGEKTNRATFLTFKKSTSASSPNALQKPPEEVKSDTQLEKKKAEEATVKKEIFIIKHRKSHEIERRFKDEERENSNGELVNSYGIMGAAQVRTSSCTKEELDAILIQCGRLSRSSSNGKAAVSGSGVSSENGASNLQKGRKYIGSKRSFDFDNENGREGRSTDEKNVFNVGDDGVDGRESEPP